MITGYSYDLWDGEKVIGKHWVLFKIWGKALIVPELSPLKQPYNRKPKEIRIPLIYREVYNDGVEIHYRITLDVSRKSDRQIAILLKRG